MQEVITIRKPDEDPTANFSLTMVRKDNNFLVLDEEQVYAIMIFLQH